MNGGVASIDKRDQGVGKAAEGSFQVGRRCQHVVLGAPRRFTDIAMSKGSRGPSQSVDEKAQSLRGKLFATQMPLQRRQIVGRASDETGAKPTERFSLECHAARFDAARTARRSLASSMGSKGLVMTPAAPRPMSLPRSWLCALAVMKTTGVSAAAGISRRALKTPGPSMTGIITSRSTTSGCQSLPAIMAMASAPDSAVRTAMSWSSAKDIAAISRMSGSSST